MKIGSFDTAEKVLVIAEIGNNHEGSYAVAEELIGKAAEAGADAVKFQTIRAEHLVGKQNTERFNKLKSFELTDNQFERLARQARNANILFLSTPFDLGGVQFLSSVADAIKISSGDNTFYPLIEEAARTDLPLIISSGMASIGQIKMALGIITKIRKEKLILQETAVLHCVSAYPTPASEANLSTIPYLAEQLGCPVGYSDHTLGIDAAVLAVAMGARIIEKHFTIDTNYSDFRDHQLSADPAMLKNMIHKIRQTETLLGVPDKSLQDSEKDGVVAYRRSIVAARNLKKGALLEQHDIAWVRPGDGLAPGNEPLIIGHKLKCNIGKGHYIKLEDVL